MKSKFLSLLVASSFVLVSAAHAADPAPGAKPAPASAAPAAPAAATPAAAPAPTAPAAAAAAPAADPAVKKATASGICHDKTSPSFKQKTKFIRIYTKNLS